MSPRTKYLGSSQVCVIVTSLIFWHAGTAGLLDSPPPNLQGGTSQVVFRMGPIYFLPGRMDTVVTCTNLSDHATQVAIEIFDATDTLAVTAAKTNLDIAGVVSFVTSANSTSLGQVVIAGLPPVDHGKARVSATTTELSCTAIHRVLAADGSIENKALSLVKKIGPQPPR